jgi:hypothetical protein
MTIAYIQRQCAAKDIILVRENDRAETAYNQRFTARTNGHRMIVLTQGADVATLRASPDNDRDETPADYWGGAFFDSLPRCFRYMGVLPREAVAA